MSEGLFVRLVVGFFILLILGGIGFGLVELSKHRTANRWAPGEPAPERKVVTPLPTPLPILLFTPVPTPNTVMAPGQRIVDTPNDGKRSPAWIESPQSSSRTTFVPSPTVDLPVVTPTSLPIHSWEAELIDIQNNLRQCMRSRASTFLPEDSLEDYAEYLIREVTIYEDDALSALDLAFIGAIHDCWRLDFGGDLELTNIRRVMPVLYPEDDPSPFPDRLHQCLVKRADAYKYSPPSEQHSAYINWVSLYADNIQEYVKEEMQRGLLSGYRTVSEIGVTHACWRVDVDD